MAGGYPELEICNGTSVGPVYASTTGTTLTSGAANTKGSWTQLTASLASDCCYIGIHTDPGASTSSDQYAVDIGIGTAGSEVVIINNLIVDFSATSGPLYAFLFPVCIPAGTRVAARCQCIAASDVMDAFITLYDGSFTQIEGFAGVDSIGFLTASTIGTAITASNSANVKGSYSQFIASTSKDYAGFVIAPDTNNALIAASAHFFIDISIGAAGSEQIIIPDLYMVRSHASGRCEPENTGIYWIPVPSGTRMAARCQSNVSGALINITLYGIYR